MRITEGNFKACLDRIAAKGKISAAQALEQLAPTHLEVPRIPADRS